MVCNCLQYLAFFIGCMSGPDIFAGRGGCDEFWDFDGNRTVDLFDFAELQNAFEVPPKGKEAG